jgi:hypothetical protein
MRDPASLLQAEFYQVDAAAEYADAMRRRDINPTALDSSITDNQEDGAVFSRKARERMGVYDRDQFYA